jgi:hypothetical protein
MPYVAHSNLLVEAQKTTSIDWILVRCRETVAMEAQRVGHVSDDAILHSVTLMDG